MIEELLRPPVVAVDATHDPAGVVLFPEEEALVARAVDGRRREFATVRSCARLAMARLGVPPVPILPGQRGAPRWPSGVVGSMTHCAGYRAAALARQADVTTIGVDAEPNLPLPDGVLDMVTVPAEREMLARLRATGPRVCWDRLVFSAKESVYKAWSPLTGQWLGFEEATVTIEGDASGPDTLAGSFVAVLVAAPGRWITGFTGRWMCRDGLLVTAISVPSGPTGPE